MKLDAMRGSDIVCWECQGEPNFVYFNQETREILSVICTRCRSVYESSVFTLGQGYCEAQDDEEDCQGCA